MKTIGYWSLIETSKPVIERTSKTKEHKTRFVGLLRKEKMGQKNSACRCEGESVIVTAPP